MLINEGYNIDSIENIVNAGKNDTYYTLHDID